MTVTTATTVDCAQALAAALGTVEVPGLDAPEPLRVFTYVADSARVPCALIGLPIINFNDPEATFCHASWAFPVALVVSRNSDKAAQDSLSRLVSDCAQALNSADTALLGVFSIEPLDASPATIAISGQELPGYRLNVRVRA